MRRTAWPITTWAAAACARPGVKGDGMRAARDKANDAKGIRRVWQSAVFAWFIPSFYKRTPPPTVCRPFSR